MSHPQDTGARQVHSTQDDTSIEESTIDNPFGMRSFISGERTDDENADAELKHAMAKVVDTPEGKHLIFEILARAHIYDATHNGNSRDIFVNGKREIGLWLIDTMESVDETIYPAMLHSIAISKRNHRLASKAAEKGNDNA